MRGKIIVDGYHFKNENEYRRYKGIQELVKDGRLQDLDVNPKYPLMVNQVEVDSYSPTFRFYDPVKHAERFIQVSNAAQSAIQELRIRLFEAIYSVKVERWG